VVGGEEEREWLGCGGELAVGEDYDVHCCVGFCLWNWRFHRM
jgi:hypothetical protein